jgi:hypothetical protein
VAFRLKRLTSFAPVRPVFFGPRLRSSALRCSGGSVDCQRPGVTNVMEARYSVFALSVDGHRLSAISYQLKWKAEINPKRSGYVKINLLIVPVLTVRRPYQPL